MSKITTNEGAIQYDHSLDHGVEFFSKAGSVFVNKKGRKAFYNNESTAIDLFKNVWYSGNYELAMKLLFWLRDCRGGAGNRSAFRECVKWVVETDPKWINANIEIIPEIGRWDDLRSFIGTDSEKIALDMWAKAVLEKNSLACKWLNLKKDMGVFKIVRKNSKIKDIGEFRRLVAEGRKNIVERKMCSKAWAQIEYSHVPSVAMSRYTKAFNKNDEERFAKFKEKVQKGEAKINASVLFPHDLTRTVFNGDTVIADEQFKALPNWVGDSKLRIMVICDTSGSMESIIGGSVQAWHVSTSLALYCSDRIPVESPFHRKFIQFESESKLTDWKGHTFSEAYGLGKNPMGKVRPGYYGGWGVFDGSCGGTRIDNALDMLLNHATMFGATNDQIPNMLLIISDMQFHGVPLMDNGKTIVENCLTKWENSGYNRPKIIYWNTAGFAGSPATIAHKDVGLISGFSPSILEAILSAEDFTPLGIMLKKLEKYNVKIPR
jgi:hypothetical protein